LQKIGEIILLEFQMGGVFSGAANGILAIRNMFSPSAADGRQILSYGRTKGIVIIMKKKSIHAVQ
jgi:hypothetical protein